MTLLPPALTSSFTVSRERISLVPQLSARRAVAVGVLGLSIAGIVAGSAVPSAPAKTSPYSGYHDVVTTHTERLVIRGGSLIETVTVTHDYLRTKE